MALTFARISTPARHLPSIRALEQLAVAWCFATPVGVIFDGLEEGSRPASASGARSMYSGEIVLRSAMRGYLVELAAFFLEPYPQPVLLWKIARQRSCRRPSGTTASDLWPAQSAQAKQRPAGPNPGDSASREGQKAPARKTLSQSR